MRDSVNAGLANRVGWSGIRFEPVPLLRNAVIRRHSTIAAMLSTPFIRDTKTMAKTYAQLSREIEALQAKAEAVRKAEMSGVISRIRQAVVAYGLTAEELGFGKADGSALAPPKKGTAPPGAKKQRAAKKTKPGVKYRDADGHVWTGRGPKPRWLKAAVAAGQSLDSLLVGGGGADTGADSPTGALAPAKSKKQGLAAKYKDEAGHSWSGRGPKPGWFKDALGSGKTLDDLRA